MLPPPTLCNQRVSTSKDRFRDAIKVYANYENTQKEPAKSAKSILSIIVMSDDNKSPPLPSKPIIKRPSISFQIKDEKNRAPATSVDSTNTKNVAGDSAKAGSGQLGIPTFFGSFKKNAGRAHGASVSSIRTTQSDPATPSRVRWSERLSWRSISAINFNDDNLDDDEIRERQNRFVEMQDDPNYLPGFVDLYYSEEITITEETCCCCSAHTTYKIRDDRKSKLMYAAIKEIDGGCAAFLKFWCMRKYHIMRIGFTILVFNARTKDTKLLTFRRKTHWHADQLDIVETYYSIENAHVGRIEKTSDGFRLIDQRGKEAYRIFRESKKEKKILRTSGNLIVFCVSTRKIVAKISYTKRNFLGKFFSMFLRSEKHTIKWSLEIGIKMKTLLLGVLFVELHSLEEYVDLPLGSDTNTTMNNSKVRRNT